MNEKDYVLTIDTEDRILIISHPERGYKEHIYVPETDSMTQTSELQIEIELPDVHEVSFDYPLDPKIFKNQVLEIYHKLYGEYSRIDWLYKFFDHHGIKMGECEDDSSELCAIKIIEFDGENTKKLIKLYDETKNNKT